jgi:hypothetical protein
VRSPTRPNDATSQKITLFIATAVRTLDSAVVVTSLISHSISDAAEKETFGVPQTEQTKTIGQDFSPCIYGDPMMEGRSEHEAYFRGPAARVFKRCFFGCWPYIQTGPSLNAPL